MENKTRLLSTATLERPLVQKAVDAGVLLDALSFIQVVDITDENDLQEQIENLCRQQATVVFTSVNAVKAICETAYFSVPAWQIYCIGNATKSAVLEYFTAASIKGAANDSLSLASAMVSDGVKEVVFFCGDKRMDTLPDVLAAAGVRVTEVVVYKTIETPQFVAKDYDGILFFSPSAVSSFFNLNIIGPGTVLFAIGETTAAAIKEQVQNPIIIADTPSKDQVVAKAIQYFKIAPPI